MKFGIIGAIAVEVEQIKKEMQIDSKETHFGAIYHIGKLANHDIVVVECGVGKIAAAVCSYTMVEVFKVDYVINTGIAGALGSGLKILDVVIGSEMIFHDIDHSLYKRVFPFETVFYADDTLVKNAERAIEELGDITYHVGKIATGDEFVNSNELKDKIIKEFSPLCVEMEGAAIAQVAAMNKTPFLIIRTMSDNADSEAEETYDDLFDRAAKISSGLLIKMIENFN